MEGTHVSELLFQIPTRSVDIRGSWRGKPEILENSFKCRRYVADVTGLDLLSLGQLDGGVQCFGEFGASGRARTMKIGRRVRGAVQFDLIKSFSPIRTYGGLKGEEKLEKLRYF